MAPFPLFAQNSEFCSQMMRSVIRISGKNSRGEPVFGTGFIVGIKGRFSKRYEPVLITATHVFEAIAGSKVNIGLRKKTGQGYIFAEREIKIKLGKEPLWVTRKGYDIAAIRMNFPEKFDVVMVALESLISKKIMQNSTIGTGSTVQVLGYPYGVSSTPAGFSILRQAVISSFPLFSGNSANEFMVDFEVFQGYSGAPIIYSNNKTRYVIGMISEEVFLEEISRKGKKVKKISRGLGIAKAIHAEEILKLLRSM